jgi:hypothetical protein
MNQLSTSQFISNKKLLEYLDQEQNMEIGMLDRRIYSDKKSK